MNLSGFYRRDGTFLTPLDQQYALIDQEQERVIILNEAGAWIWSRLGSQVDIPPSDRDNVEPFIETLHRHGLLQKDGTAVPELEPVGRLRGTPAILNLAPLQVAAGNSTDPFDVGW